MSVAKTAIDPLWKCLCPSWTTTISQPTKRLFSPSRRAALQCLSGPRLVRTKSDEVSRYYASRARDDGKVDPFMSPLYDPPIPEIVPRVKRIRHRAPPGEIDYKEESTELLYEHLRSSAINGKVEECQRIVKILLKEKDEQPNVQIFNSLILSNISTHGTAWRVSELLDEMMALELPPDVQTCHAVLKVTSVHVDHLLRADILQYMSQKWLQLSADGAHDIVAGLMREGLFEQGLERLETMRRSGMHINGWLLDMVVYVLCEAEEISEAYRVMLHRVDVGELSLSRSLWAFFLDKASEARHHAATALVWSGQVNREYINPASGVCLNALTTAARAGDAVMATEVFTKLSERGTPFRPIHYELLISTYLSANPPDLRRALTVLSIMASEKPEPSVAETRPLFLYLRDRPDLMTEALATLRELHNQNRKIPIAALNLLVECFVEQENLADALKIYKQVHTFVPIVEGAKRTFANIDTFNLLLKGCRVAEPPEAEQASFLVSELLALRIKPTTLTYDRLILVFVLAGKRAIEESLAMYDDEARVASKSKGIELIDWAYRHFVDMQSLSWMPRFGTLENLSIELARLGDTRCWDVFQAGEDQSSNVDSWDKKGHWVRKKLEDIWEVSAMKNEEDDSASSGEKDNGDAEDIEQELASESRPYTAN